MKYYVRPESSAENRIGPKIGPFKDFFQVTYGELRVGPNGDTIADNQDGLWHFYGTFKTADYKPEGSPRGYRDVVVPADFTHAHNCTELKPSEGWTDFVIWAEE